MMNRYPTMAMKWFYPMMSRYNFGAGPAQLPPSVLLEVQSELLNWQGLHQSVLEVGHRTPAFLQLMEQLEGDLRNILQVPTDYHVLFLGSPARLQFSMIPLNLLTDHDTAGYLVTGLWSAMAFEEACRLKTAYCLTTTKEQGFTTLPPSQEWSLRPHTRYVYYTPNETVNGVRFSALPEVGGVPLVADMTSCLLTEPIRVADFGLIFAGAQKNLGASGLSIVIVHRDLLVTKSTPLATLLDYQTHVTHRSLYATPPVFSCYLAQKMLAFVRAEGGISALYEQNIQKSQALYRYIDESSFYHATVAPEARSLINVCFSLNDTTLEAAFLAEANQRGLYALQGHRAVGGLRASLYNAMPMEGVLALIAFMQDFVKEHG